MSDTPALVVIEKLGNAVIAHVNVKLLDEAGLKLLGQLIDQSAGEPGVSLVVVDLSGVRLIPSLGLGVLIQISSKCKARGQSLKLAATPPPIRQVFAITRLDRVLEMADSVEAATRSPA